METRSFEPDTFTTAITSWRQIAAGFNTRTLVNDTPDVEPTRLCKRLIVSSIPEAVVNAQASTLRNVSDFQFDNVCGFDRIDLQQGTLCLYRKYMPGRNLTMYLQESRSETEIIELGDTNDSRR